MKVRIYQVSLDRAPDRAFMPYKYVEQKCAGLVQMRDYDMVYECDNHSLQVFNLEELYQALNVNIPDDYHGRSMSVSDIVELEGNRNYWYCDSIGFRPLTNVIY